MSRIRFFCLILALALAIFPVSAVASQVDCDDVYCFTSADFQQEGESPLVGVCITGLPDPATGTVLLGQRVLQPGDILTAQQLAQLTFHPLRTEADCVAEISYLPIYENRVASSATMVLSVRGKEDKAPAAEDAALETYKNLPLEGVLKVSDPEGESLTYSLVRGPKRGQVEIGSDGTFVYTPKKNKVGVDSFTYTAADPAGNVSRVATVTIQILKPSDSRQYTDTAGTDCRFTAEWMRHTGLFTGEAVNGQLCFHPEKTVSRGEFLAMLVKTLDIPTDREIYSQIPANTPSWLQPYLAAALRAGLTAGWPDTESFSEAITGAEAAVMIQNALDLSISRQTLESQSASHEDQEAVPAWAELSLAAMADNGLAISPNRALTRAEVSVLLYQVDHMAVDTAGAAVFRMQ